MTAMLSAEKASAFYGPLQALHEASLSVERGEIVVLVGANRRRQEHFAARYFRCGAAERKSRFWANGSIG